MKHFGSNTAMRAMQRNKNNISENQLNKSFESCSAKGSRQGFLKPRTSIGTSSKKLTVQNAIQNSPMTTGPTGLKTTRSPSKSPQLSYRTIEGTAVPNKSAYGVVKHIQATGSRQNRENSFTRSPIRMAGTAAKHETIQHRN